MKRNKIIRGICGGVMGTAIVPLCMLIGHGAGYLSDDTRVDYSLKHRFSTAYNPNANWDEQYYRSMVCMDSVTGWPCGDVELRQYPMIPGKTYPAHLVLAALGAWLGATTKKQKLRALVDIKNATK